MSQETATLIGLVLGCMVIIAHFALWIAWLIKAMQYRLHVRYEGDPKRATEMLAAYWRTVQRCRDAGVPERTLRRAFNRVVIKEDDDLRSDTNGECDGRTIRIRPDESFIRYGVTELLVRRVGPTFKMTKHLATYDWDGTDRDGTKTIEGWFKARGCFPTKP